jgi:predicted transposase/invertase (TIGR01784 family)
MSSISNPHDTFFKQTFSQPEVIHNFLVEYLPPEVATALNLDGLELQKDSFVDSQLQEHFSDLLYKCPLVGEETAEAFVYLLLEHKSSPEKLTPLQLLGYMVQIWQSVTRQGKDELPPIIPMVIYHGRSRWRVVEDFAGLFKGPESLRPYWPAFRYQLYDLGRYSREELRGMAWNRIIYLILKHIRDPDFPEKFPGILRLFQELSNAETAVEYLRVVLVYVSGAANVTQDAVKAALETGFTQDGDAIMTDLLTEWIEEKVEKGKQQATINSILDILLLRFDVAPPAVSERLEKIEDVEVLRQLNRQAVTAESLADFEQLLDTYL